MKIDDRKGVLDPQLVGTDPTRPDGRAAVPPAAQTGDRVSVSDTARQLAGLRAAVGDLDGVRQERVAVLQSAIDAGRYDVDPQAVAQSFLREVTADALR